MPPSLALPPPPPPLPPPPRLLLSSSPSSTWALAQACRASRPLCLCLTNYVSMDLAANTLLAAGASPCMAHCPLEVEAFVELSSAVLVNVGTLSEDWVVGMRLAARQAGALGRPWVLDPVGCGATPYRTQVCVELLQLRPTVVRGNASEILALEAAAAAAVEAGEGQEGQGLQALEAGGPALGATTRGVDSTAAATDALAAGRRLARRQRCVVAISGPEDLAVGGGGGGGGGGDTAADAADVCAAGQAEEDGTSGGGGGDGAQRLLRVANGVPMLQQITATGCSVTALIAAFVGVAPQQPLEATAHALAYFGLAAELAGAAGAQGPGTLRAGLLDCLWGASEEQVLGGIRIRE